MDEIEIQAFEADTRASKGLTAAHMADAASSYDPEKNPAPLVFGHPSNDSPALGVVASARAEGAKLFLTMKNMAKELVDGVKERRIINRSIAFWAPDHPSNPTPGKYSIRHLGFLGGQAPAIPNMPALRFSADESALESDEGPADAIIFSVEPKPTGVQEVREPAPVEEFSAMTEAEIQAAKEANEAEAARLATEKAALDKRQTEYAARETERRESENTAAIDAGIAAGKVLPAEKADLQAIFNALPVEPLTFASLGEGELEPRIALGKFLEALPQRTALPEGQKSPANEFAATGNKEKADAALKAANERDSSAYRAPAKADA